MTKKGYSKVKQKIKQNLIIAAALILVYGVIQYLFPIKGLAPLDRFINYSYRMIAACFFGAGYLYNLIAQFYRYRSNKSLTLELLTHHKQKSLVQIIIDSIKITPSKYLVTTPGINKNEVSGVVLGIDDRGFLVESPFNEEEHLLCIGGSGSGKTSAILIPTLRSFKGTFFTVDISGDIAKNVRRTETQMFDPYSIEPVSYNVFYFVDRASDTSERNELISQLAYLIMPEIDTKSGDSHFFRESGREMLIASLINYYEQDKDFNEICRRILYLETNELLNEIWQIYDEIAQLNISSFRGTNEKNNAGCKQNMDSAIRFFATNANMQRILHRPRVNEKSIDPSILENSDVILQIPEVKLSIYSPFLSIIIAQTFEYCSQRSLSEKNTILFALDEFSRLGRVDILNALRTLRKRHIRILLLTQSFADLDAVYGRENRMIIADNCGYKVILKITDPDTQDYVSRLIGEQDVIKQSHNWNSNQNGYTEVPHKERIIQPAELAYLGNRLLIHSPEGYRFLNKNYYFKKDQLIESVTNQFRLVAFLFQKLLMGGNDDHK